MKNKKLTALQKRKITSYVRAGIQIIFFIFFPSAFTAGFAGIKYICTQIGAGDAVKMTSFVMILIALLAFTFVFGRFFCGFACAFGSYGDAVRFIYTFICKKFKKKPYTLKGRALKYLVYLKYIVLLAICVLCFAGVYSSLHGYSPWDVFSSLRSGNFALSGYIFGIILLCIITIGDAVCERFFCRFLCPFGAVFSIIPVLPFFSINREREKCAKGCNACQKICPANIDIHEKGNFETSGECFQCQKCIGICPKKNTSGSVFKKIRGNEIWFTLIRAAILAVCFVILGV